MKKDKIQISIIIVNYKVEKELVSCISSIVKSKSKVLFEIIVIDNDRNNNLRDTLKENFPQVRYKKSSINLGYGAGNNLGERYALGEFLFFLNPDTVVKENCMDILLNFIENNPNSGMVAPLLLGPSGSAYLNQGSDAYSLKSAIVTSSFINKIFPNNLISRKFFHKNWNKEKTEEFDVVPGTAFMIRKSLFKKSGMFDERFFLYFEEYDLAKRIKKLGYKNYIVPFAKVIHMWEISTKKRKDINKIFSKSRYLFFKKNYGIFFALIIHLLSNIGKYEVLLFFILVISVFLSSFRIRELMPFIGDQGWFYLSARDMLVNGQIPLVGIASSHLWLHQGPLWTYLLALFLWIFNFDPVSGAYITILFGVFSVVGIYMIGSTIFSRRVGILASILYGTSPLIVSYMRLPYHTSPIPFFTLVFIFSLHKIVKNKFTYLPLMLIMLAILYNFEIATSVLWAVVLIVFAYKLFRAKIHVAKMFNKKTLILSVFALAIPLLPMILYDIRNGFPQTFKFVGWAAYRMTSLLVNNGNAFSLNKIFPMTIFLFDNFKKLIFTQSNLISFAILLILIVWVIYILFQKKNSYNLFFLLLFIPLIFVTLNQTPSDAYLPVFFPIIILLFASFLDFIMNKKNNAVIVFILIIIMVLCNINFMLKNNFYFDESSKLFTLNKRVDAVYKILNIADGRDYNLIGTGPGSKYSSFTMNYEYLAWRLGREPSKNNKNLKIYVSESKKGINIGNY